MSGGLCCKVARDHVACPDATGFTAIRTVDRDVFEPSFQRGTVRRGILTQAREAFCIGCGTFVATSGPCSQCGADSFAIASDGVVFEFTGGAMPCNGCGLTSRLKFRGWAYTWSFVYFARTSHKAGYFCDDCADMEGAKALFFTSLLGWWSLPSWLWVGWRATYLNWRATFAPPRRPLDWGALTTDELLQMIGESNEAFEDDEDQEDEEFVGFGAAMDGLTRAQRSLVANSSGLYELLGLSKTASTSEIKTAFRARARDAHPDLNGEPDAALMIELNKAWEVLGNQVLRAAYDRVQAVREFA